VRQTPPRAIQITPQARQITSPSAETCAQACYPGKRARQGACRSGLLAIPRAIAIDCVPFGDLSEHLRRLARSSCGPGILGTQKASNRHEVPRGPSSTRAGAAGRSGSDAEGRVELETHSRILRAVRRLVPMQRGATGADSTGNGPFWGQRRLLGSLDFSNRSRRGAPSTGTPGSIRFFDDCVRCPTDQVGMNNDAAPAPPRMPTAKTITAMAARTGRRNLLGTLDMASCS
jgi:hypothetical protein